MKKSVLILMVTVLTGCVDMPKPNYNKLTGVPDSEYNALYDKCIKEQAEILDDGTSPADVIGSSIADACNREYIAWAMSTVATESQRVQNMFYRKITYDRELALSGPTHYILTKRAYFRKNKTK